MSFPAKLFGLLAALISVPAHAQLLTPNWFRHVVVIVQENRTPDNLFHGLCTPPYGSSLSCSAAPNPGQYNIATRDWLDKTSPTGITQPTGVPLGVSWDLAHNHAAFIAMCDASVTGTCKMDGAASIPCTGHPTCPPNPQFEYVDSSDGLVNPYLELATQYGWGNYVFQTNQGSSYPAHQYLFGGTAARSASEDAAGIFVAENPSSSKTLGYDADAYTGCLAPATEWNWLISPQTAPGETKLLNSPLGAFCYGHDTMATLIDQNVNLSWKYYSMANPIGHNPGGTIITAPNSIQAICMPDANFQNCTGPEWNDAVDLDPSDVLTDISNCNLRSVSWVTPIGQNSDHAGSANTIGGPSWVASVVNAIGNDTTCEHGKGYWSDTAIIITWDDWGGWYDHEPPTIRSNEQGDYEYGFRVPMIVVSAYTPRRYISNIPNDFGSILRFIERTFDLPGGEGALGFADQRANGDLGLYFHLNKPARKFTTIDAPLKADFFLHDKRTPEPADDD